MKKRPAKKSAKKSATKKPARKQTRVQTRLVNKKPAFLRALNRLPNVVEAARKVGIDRSIHYQWMTTDPAYAENVRAIIAHQADQIEATGEYFAFYHTEKLYTAGGLAIIDPETKKHAVKLVPNARLIEVYLKRHKPEYRERFDVQHSGPDGGPIETHQVTDAELKKRAGELTNRIASFLHTNGNGKRNGNGSSGH